MKKGAINAIVVVVLLAVLAGLAWVNRAGRIQDLRGQPLDLEQYKGQVVLVNFWATWCQPCRIEIPWFIEFQERYGGQGFTVLGVALDDEGAAVVEPYVENERFAVNGVERAINYPILIGGPAVEKQFNGIWAMPTSVLIARDGTRVKRFIGLVNHDLLKEEIEKLL